MHHSTSLKWVHEEFQEILEGSIHALDGIAEGSTGSAKLQDISNDLHELRLVLELMEVYGGAMLVEEMESLIQGLMEKKIEQEDAREILMMALLQLPAYLERVRTSSQDNPLLLLPLLNDIRAVQRRPLLSENSLFSPDLSLPIPGQPAPVLESGKVKPETLWLYFKRLRPYYQKALVQWFQGREEAKGLKLMGSVFEHLERVSGGTQIGHTWWIAAGVVEALREGGLTSNVTLKLLLGQLDRQIKGLAENGAAVLNSPVSPELQKNLLYYIARSRSAGERVKQIVTLFRLKELLPTESGDGAEAASWGPDLEVLNSVSDAVMEDLAQVKDTLDIFVRSDSSSPEDLGPMLETLKRVEDTLGLLGLGVPRKTVKSQSAAIERILASGEFPSEEILMGIAGALLDVDAALQGMAARGLGNAINQRDLKAEGGAVRLSHHEQAQLLATVVGEGGRNLAAVKEALIAFLDAPDSVDQLKSAIERSREVIGSLALLAYDKAARVLQECTRYMTEVLESRAPNLPPDEETLQAFADSLVGVECFLEAVKEGRTDCEGIIEWAAQRLIHLGMAPEIGVEEQDQDIEEVSLAPEPEEPEEPEEELASVEVMDEGVLADEAEEITLESSTGEEHAPGTGEAGAEQDNLPPEADSMPGESPLPEMVEESLRTAKGVLRKIEGEAEGTAALLPGEQGVGEDGARDGVEGREEGEDRPIGDSSDSAAGVGDPEIVEIFVEEAGEVMETIAGQIPIWRDNPEDEEPMSTIRRSFHTLKGSGRLVGATEIGELAWHIERMLNRVLDGAVALNPAMLDLVDEVYECLPALVEGFKQGIKGAVNVQELMERADTLGNQVVVTPDGGSDDGGTSSSKGGVSNAATGGAGAEVEEREPEGIPESPPEDGSIGGPQDGDQDEPQDEDGEFEDPSVVSSGSDQGVHTRLEPANETSVIEIFRYEVATHQVTIQAYLSSAAGEAPDPAPITRELVLACQTLHGSAKVAGIAELAELFGLLEEVLDNRFERNIPITEDELPALWEGADLLTVAMEKLESDPGRMVDAGSSLFDPAASARREDLLQQLRVLNDSISPSSMADQSEPDKEQTAVSGERPTVRKEQMGIAAGDGDDLVHELREVFIEEAEEILEANDAVFQEWRKSPADLEPIKKLQRQLHTLKGGARMAELPAIGDLGHGLESALTLVVDGLLPVTNQLRELVQSADDRLAEMLDIVRKNEAPEAADDILARIDGLISPGTDTLPLSEYADQKVDRLVGEQGLMGGESVTEPGLMSKASHETVSADKEDRVQIRAQALDSFVNYAGEISISRSRVEQQMGEFKYSLDEMDQTVNRLRDQLRGLEIEAESQIIYRHETVTTPREEDFDPLELDRFSQMQQLSRGLLESVSDLESIQNLLEDLTRESETILLQQARINTDLQQGLMKMRLLPVARHVPRLRRIIRQTAKALNKRVELHVQGQNEELDHTILGRIVAPLEHVLRNAVDHGIEAPEERRNAGKPEIGTIELLVSRDGSEAVIRIRDDGRGLNMDAIHRQAAERGLLPEGTNLTDEELVQLVFEQAFSTASKVTQISGRGVGLGVVSTEVKQLGGSLQVESNPGAGTTFTIRLPTTLSVTQALMVMAGDEVFAAPLGSVEGIVRLNHGQIVALLADESPIYQHLGNPYSVAYLGDLLGLGVEPLSRENIRYPVLLARAGEHRMAFVVDRLSGRREVVIKPIGSQLSAIRWIAGATILGDGRVVIILDIPALIRKGVMSPVLRRQEEKPFERAIEQQTPMIMVVDDSITVRKVTERFLLRHGMDVQLARDGVEALALLQNHKPDIMLLDIEMPRMDGYELATTVRHDESLKDLPIIMITSRAGKKHTERARRIGVNRYLGKPYQEGELLSSIQDLLISTHA